MRTLLDLYGKRFGRLLVLRLSPSSDEHNNAWWLCRCDCGVRRSIRRNALVSGWTRSCGCLSNELASARLSKHNMKLHPLERSIYRLRSRCRMNVDYVERGINVCDEWLKGASEFIDWSLENDWQPGLQLDRIDNNKGYSPDNCRWVTAKQNSNNKRNNRIITAFGITGTVSELIDRFMTDKNNVNAVYRRLRNGWLPEDALTKPLTGRRYE